MNIEKLPKLQSYPRSIRCLRAVEAIVGGRDRLATALGVTPATINRWITRRTISKSAIIGLVVLSEKKFTAEDFLIDDTESLNARNTKN